MGNDETVKGVTRLDSARYWIWLQQVMGIGSRVDCIFEEFESAKAVYDASADRLKISGIFEKGRFERAIYKGLDRADEIVEECSKSGCQIITPDMPEYPDKLKQISDFPLVLFVKGNVKSLDNEKVHVGVIGTRKPSQYGIDVATSMSLTLAECGAVVVSGGALGIDSLAHSYAMEGGGETVSILGCGLDYPYLSENAPLRERIIENGALVSEYPPSSPPFRSSFVMRNRITAGLCNGVLVVEAGQKSGSLNTAKAVMKYNRDLFVVVGDARGENFYGANELAKKGARIAFSGADIYSFYGYEIKNKDSFNFSTFKTEEFQGSDVFPYGENENKKKNKPKKKTKKSKTVSEDLQDAQQVEEKQETDVNAFSQKGQTVYRALEKFELEIDEIARETNLIIREVLIALSELEVAGAVECGPGNKYRLK